MRREDAPGPDQLTASARLRGEPAGVQVVDEAAQVVQPDVGRRRSARRRPRTGRPRPARAGTPASTSHGTSRALISAWARRTCLIWSRSLSSTATSGGGPTAAPRRASGGDSPPRPPPPRPPASARRRRRSRDGATRLAPTRRPGSGRPRRPPAATGVRQRAGTFPDAMWGPSAAEIAPIRCDHRPCGGQRPTPSGVLVPSYWGRGTAQMAQGSNGPFGSYAPPESGIASFLDPPKNELSSTGFRGDLSLREISWIGA